MEGEQTKNKDEAPVGTYDFLHRLRGRTYKDTDPTQHRSCLIQEERFCPETGGSCMDLIINEGDLDGGATQLHAHITDKNQIFRLEGSLSSRRKGRDYHKKLNFEYLKPNLISLSSMIDTVKAIRASFDTDPYDRPIR